jgi:hypothetical protein
MPGEFPGFFVFGKLTILVEQMVDAYEGKTWGISSVQKPAELAEDVFSCTSKASLG